MQFDLIGMLEGCYLSIIEKNENSTRCIMDRWIVQAPSYSMVQKEEKKIEQKEKCSYLLQKQSVAKSIWLRGDGTTLDGILVIYGGDISDLNCYHRKQFFQPNFHWFHHPCGWLYGKMSTRTNQDDIFAVARQLEMRSQKHVRFWRRQGAQWFQRAKNRQKLMYLMGFHRKSHSNFKMFT